MVGRFYHLDFVPYPVQNQKSASFFQYCAVVRAVQRILERNNYTVMEEVTGRLMEKHLSEEQETGQSSSRFVK